MFALAPFRTMSSESRDSTFDYPRRRTGSADTADTFASDRSDGQGGDHDDVYGVVWCIVLWQYMVW